MSSSTSKTPEKPAPHYECAAPTCDETFASWDDFYDHTKIVHPHERNTFYCLQRHRCGCVFYNVDDLKEHAQNHLLMEHFVCKVCSLQYESIEEVMHHMSIEHPTPQTMMRRFHMVQFGNESRPRILDLKKEAEKVQRPPTQEELNRLHEALMGAPPQVRDVRDLPPSTSTFTHLN